MTLDDLPKPELNMTLICQQQTARLAHAQQVKEKKPKAEKKPKRKKKEVKETNDGST